MPKKRSSLSASEKKQIRNDTKYRKCYIKLHLFKNEYQPEYLLNLHKNDFPAYRRYRRLVNNVEKMESDGLISQAYKDFVQNEANVVLQQTRQQLIEEQQEKNDRDLPQDQPERLHHLLREVQEDQLIQVQEVQVQEVQVQEVQVQEVQVQQIQDRQLQDRQLNNDHQLQDPQPPELQQYDEQLQQNEQEQREIQVSNRYCENCLRKQSQYLTTHYGELYTLEFTRCQSDEICKRRKFRRIRVSNNNITSFWLCQECTNYLVSESDTFESKNIWPAFVYSTLANEEVMNAYGIKVWQLIPTLWRHWWVDNIRAFIFKYRNISLEFPKCIIIDRSYEKDEWTSDIESQLLPRIASACNKYMLPCILCPWGCTEYVFSCGHVSLDIVFQRFLPKVNIDLINNIDLLKYIQFARDDYIRFDGNYDCWLLNQNEWMVMPSVCYVDGKGMQFMVCKDHNKGSTSAYIHPLRQPNHILPCKYSDQICHAVIKPRTITQMKAQKYSNTFQMQEQRGNFNGIDTCSVTQYRNFKLISILLEEYESRSIRGRPDINTLLNQFVKDELISPQSAEVYRDTAKGLTENLNIEKQSFGSTYVPARTAILMQQEINIVDVIWDCREDRIEDHQHMKPQFPKFLYPIQKCDKYGAFPLIIPFFTDNNRYTDMLWILTGILSRVEEVWAHITTKVPLRQSHWHGWLLTYITNKCLSQINTRASKGDPFRMMYIRTISRLMEKMVSTTV